MHAIHPFAIHRIRHLVALEAAKQKSLPYRDAYLLVSEKVNEDSIRDAMAQSGFPPDAFDGHVIRVMLGDLAGFDGHIIQSIKDWMEAHPVLMKALLSLLIALIFM